MGNFKKGLAFCWKYDVKEGFPKTKWKCLKRELSHGQTLGRIYICEKKQRSSLDILIKEWKRADA